MIIDREGIVRYHAALRWPHGDTYHLNEIRAVVDSILAAPSGVPDGPGAVLPGFRLESRPNPFRSSTEITFTNPDDRPAPVRLQVMDVSGRVVATLADGPAAPGVNRVRWSGSLDRGGRAASGRYVIRAELRGYVLAASVILLK